MLSLKKCEVRLLMSFSASFPIGYYALNSNGLAQLRRSGHMKTPVILKWNSLNRELQYEKLHIDECFLQEYNNSQHFLLWLIIQIAQTCKIKSSLCRHLPFHSFKKHQTLGLFLNHQLWLLYQNLFFTLITSSQSFSSFWWCHERSSWRQFCCCRSAG